MKKINISHAPNTTYITKNEGMIVHNVDNYNFGMQLWGKCLDNYIKEDVKVKEIVLSKLN